ncbi:MAG: hypothetical protein QW171_04580 [Candidatus Bilamarchaeaceae archaeon]
MKRLLYDRIPQEVHILRSPVRPLSLRLNNAVLLTGIVGTVGACASELPSVKVASLVDIPVASQNEKSQKTILVTPDMNKISDSNKTEGKKVAKVSWLKDKLKKNVGPSGWQQIPDMLEGALYTPDGLFTFMTDYNQASTKTFHLEIAYTPQKVIKLQNGALIGGFILIPSKECVKKITAGASIHVVKDNVLIGSWEIPFDKLAKAYKEKTGKDLKYTIAVVDHDSDDQGEYVAFYIIPAASFKDVKEGNIEPNIPVLYIFYDAVKNGLGSNNDEPYYITSSDKEDLAKVVNY